MLKQDLKLSVLWLGRQSRSQELRLLMLALILAVASTTLIAFLSERVDKGMQLQAAQMAGGHLIIRANEPLPFNWAEQAQQYGVKTASTAEFPSMAASEAGQFRLVSIKGVDGAYPLLAPLEIKTLAQPHTLQAVQQGPTSGEAWVDLGVLQALQLQLGDTLHLGQGHFVITGLIESEPDRGNGFYSFNPRVMLAAADIASTQLVRTGSRITYRMQFAGSPEAISAWWQALEPQLASEHRVLNLQEDRPALSNTLETATRYLHLVSLMAVLLTGIAVVLTARRYAQRQQASIALLGCLGSQRRQILTLLLSQLLLLVLFASILGSLLGWLAQNILLYFLTAWLPFDALPSASLQPVFLGTTVALLLMLGAAFPSLWRLSQIPPWRVLRPTEPPSQRADFPLHLLTGAAFFALLLAFTQDLQLTLFTGLGLGAATLSVLVIGKLLLAGLQKLLANSSQGAWQQGIRQLVRHPSLTLAQMFGFSLTFVIMALVWLVRTDMLTQWQAQLPAEAPNQFAINIQPYERQGFEAYLNQAGWPHAGLYPLVRGRIVAINGQDPASQVPASGQEDNALQRALNLTWQAELPPLNEIVSGRWWTANTLRNGEIPLSIESGFAERLGLTLGETLTFKIADRQISGQITSIRQVRWESFQPNFFVIFPPEVLLEYPHSFMTSFYLPQDQGAQVNALLNQFPSITLLNVDALLTQVRDIVRQATLAIEALFLVVLLAGILVLQATLVTSQPRRQHKGAILRVFGASRAWVWREEISELVTLGALSGILAAILTEGVAALLYVSVLKIPPSLHFELWVLLPLAGALLTFLGGLASVRKVLAYPPKRILSSH
ncbi:putative ABC transport system permease protein [Allopseudospirillum japonicum]|uniref:Putative ABC transport system permease protein n=1 Tax=Allopseudospirillum japonicum TaxID=64971 RepID=A0A1H6SUP3_9GAMM|nr:FtsX-like permease family protein [Allopseudospirillum japonicum]SEI71481.1 putative ABC transport system permease protein [Allopseudospirillum japonicum]